MKITMRKAVMVVLGIFLNLLGSFLARNLQLPLWLDMAGICVASYFSGIWGGIIAGVVNNVILGFYDITLLAYVLTSITAAIVMHVFIKKGYLKNIMKAIVSSFWLGILCTLVSTPLNIFLNDGYSGNMWGDALVDMLKQYGVSHTLSALAGSAIVEIVDRQICVLVAFAIIHIITRWRARKDGWIKTLAFVLVIGSVVCFGVQPIYALQEKVNNIGTLTPMWAKPWYKTYLFVVCLEIAVFTIISVVSMILFAIRKNELEQLQVELENKVNEQTQQLRIQQERTKELFLQTITALSGAVDAKDRYTSGHSGRVAEYALMLAARMGKSKEEQEEIYRAGLLHDVGKIRIPREIINKAGKLSDEEYSIIKVHPVTGYHILRGISGSKLIAIGAKYHHERYDGSGYPNGLVGEKIPEVARILGVADAYDAMTSNRSYRKALSQEEVRSEIEKGKGTQFDPVIADIMLQMIDQDKNYTMKEAASSHRRILVVDDDPMNSKLIIHIMRDEPQYEIIPVYSGIEALEILKQQTFDLIFLDVKMPGMDGLETLRRIREKYQTPVAFITGDRSLDTLNETAELGCEDYITKPFQPLMIKEVVHNMTERTSIEK